MTQQEITNSELIKRLEVKLEEGQKKFGAVEGKFELDLTNLKETVKEKVSEINSLKENDLLLQNKLKEADLIEDKILSDLQNIKNEKLKLESELQKKENELVELKKKVKIMRRDLSKS